jgi:2-oxoglutarate ferredoxin oxidoreductase subunit alpha
MNGNSIISEAAIRAGCRCYFGYPITPQNELPEYMSQHIEKVEGGVFIQSESEISAINMVIGASVAGARVMTSSSSPGISLKQEGLSYLAAMELPSVIVNMMRGGPGLGNIAPSQSDYFQATRGGGHGDYRTIVLAPASCQELADLTMEAFDLADLYRTPVLILADGMMGQMMEPVIFKERKKIDLPEKDYVIDGAKGRKSRMMRSLLLDTSVEEDHNWKLYRKYQEIERAGVRFDDYEMKDAQMAVVAYGTASRIAKGAVIRCRREGMKIGLIRPITLWPFPAKYIRKRGDQVKEFLAFELCMGQMVEDVRMALEGSANVSFYGRPGGVVPTPAELSKVISRRYLESGLEIFERKPLSLLPGLWS